MKNYLGIVAIVSSAVFSTQLLANTAINSTSTLQTTLTPNHTMPSNTTLATSSPADRTLVSDVQAKIAQESSLKGYNITVTSQDGIVTLSGTVNSQQQADTAVDAAMSIDGVADVKSNLIVKHAT